MQLSRGERVTMCGCQAHRLIMDPSTSRQTKDDICLLINSRSPMLDDGGKVFATALIRRILDFADSEGKLQRTSVGSDWEVSYVLKQGSQTTKYRGYPDFIIRKDGIGASFILVAVGETQSDKKDAVMQGGIYAVGKINATSNPVTCIALHKNKTANVMVAKLDRSSSPPSPPDSLGVVSYKYVEDTNPLVLTTADGVMDFANRVTTCLSIGS